MEGLFPALRLQNTAPFKRVDQAVPARVAPDDVVSLTEHGHAGETDAGLAQRQKVWGLEQEEAFPAGAGNRDDLVTAELLAAFRVDPVSQMLNPVSRMDSEPRVPYLKPNDKGHQVGVRLTVASKHAECEIPVSTMPVCCAGQ